MAFSDWIKKNILDKTSVDEKLAGLFSGKLVDPRTKDQQIQQKAVDTNRGLMAAGKLSRVKTITPIPMPTATPMPTPTPSPRPIPDQGFYPPSDPRYIDVSRNQGLSTIPVQPPPRFVADAIWNAFPKDATAAATVAFAENLGYDVNGYNPYNRNGTVDYGLFQNNSGTFSEMLAKQPFRAKLNAVGINSLDDLMGDAQKSAYGAMIRGTYGTPRENNMWNWWRGWQDRNFDPYGYTR